MSLFRGTKGVTLVEVIVSVAIVAIVVSTVVIAVAQSAVTAGRLDMIYTASNLAKKQMDRIKAMNYRDIPDRAVETGVRIDLAGEPDANGDYVRTTEVDEDWASNLYMTKIKVSVDRVENGSASGHPATIETIMADVE